MTNNKGLTLIEMLVSLIIASILILTVGVLSRIANTSFNKINNQAAIYNDISYGLKLLQFKVRGSSKIAAGNKSAPWISGQHLLVGNSDVFGLYQTSASVTDLVYESGGKKDTILSVPNPGTVAVSFSSMTSRSVAVTVSGTKNNIPFNMQTTIYRRNP